MNFPAWKSTGTETEDRVSAGGWEDQQLVQCSPGMFVRGTINQHLTHTKWVITSGRRPSVVFQSRFSRPAFKTCMHMRSQWEQVRTTKSASCTLCPQNYTFCLRPLLYSLTDVHTDSCRHHGCVVVLKTKDSPQMDSTAFVLNYLN